MAFGNFGYKSDHEQVRV